MGNKVDRATADTARRIGATVASSSAPPDPEPSPSTVEAVRRLTGQPYEDLDGLIEEADALADELRAERRRARSR